MSLLMYPADIPSAICCLLTATKDSRALSLSRPNTDAATFILRSIGVRPGFPRSNRPSWISPPLGCLEL